MIVKVLFCQFPIASPGAALICEKEIFRQGVRLVPTPALIFIVTPYGIVLYRMFREVRQRRIGGAIENGERIRVADILMRIDQTANNFVIAIRWKAILVVIVPRNRSRI